MVSPALGIVDSVELQATSDPAHQVSPAVSGDLVVWKDSRNGNWDIYAFDVASGQETAISTNASIQQNPSVSGTKVVWQDFRSGNWDIYSYDFATGEETALITQASTQQNPVVAGQILVWEDNRNGNWDVFSYDFGTQTETQITSDPGRQRLPDTDGTTIVWEDNRDGDGDIYAYNLVTQQETVITDNAWEDGQPDVLAGNIVWQEYRNGNWDIALYNTSAKVVRTLGANPDTQATPRVTANAVVWHDYRNGNWDIYLYDLTTGEERQLTDASATQWAADSDGTGVVWEDYRNGNFDVYMARLTVTVPDDELSPLDDGVTTIDDGLVTRVAGDDRYATSIAGTDGAWSDGAGTVIIATGEAYADALAASGLAGYLDAPILLTPPDALPGALADRITNLGASEAIIVGNETAVGPAVEEALVGLGLGVTRVGGQNRYDTARAIAVKMQTIGWSQYFGTAFVVRGDSFADALAVAPFAYNEGIPVLLTRPGDLPVETERAMRVLGTEHTVVVGGTEAVSDDVASRLPGLVERIAGDDRYATAVRLATHAASAGWGDFSFVGVATGRDFPDALSGGAVTGWHGGVLLLTDTERLHPAVQRALTARSAEIGSLQVFGGTNAVSESVFSQLAQIVQ